MDNNNINEYDNGPGNRGNGGPGNNNNNGKNQPSRPSGWMIIIFSLVLVACGFFIYNMFFSTGKNYKEKEYTEFLKDLEADKVESVEINAEKALMTVTLKPEAVVTEESAKEFKNATVLDQLAYTLEVENERTYQTYVMDSFDSLTPRLEAHDVLGKRVVSNNSNLWTEILVGVVLPVILLWLIAMFFMRRMGGAGGPLGVGKSNAKVYVQKETGVTFADVAGEDEAKESLVEVVDFLHDPSKYTKIGARLPKGALLVGPPGTGKTLLAKAVAGEAHVPFFSLTGSDFIELYVGVGASRVRDLFKEANKNAPCIIFIDEIDAIGRSRDSRFGGGNDEREQTLNQLLSEMDGFEPSKGILVLGATNRPEILDKALLRPGRFDHRVIVDKPDLKGRIETLRVHIKNVCINETVNLEEIALATAGAVGSDLANIINEAAILAAKEGRSSVGQADLLESVETVFAGKEKKDRILGAEEKKIVAYHECGHALVTALQKKAEPVQKITIVPRTMGSLGYVMQVPEEEKYLQSKDELITQITSLCAGRAAEELFFDSVTTGASSDIEKATNIARNMIARFGMSDKLGFVQYEDVQSKYLDGRAVRTCAESTSASIDDEIKKLIGECYETAKKIISENRDILEKAGGFLMEKETITGKQFMDIIKELRPGFEEKKQETPGETAGNGNAVIPEAEKTAQNEAKADTASDMAEQKASDEEAEAKPVQTEDQDGI